ncbi:MAG: dTMP kinase [Chloroflexi bacterium]|nr:dTMP kinase [Chloroflexota bacterium]
MQPREAYSSGPPGRGRFITIEGPDGAGKTLQAQRLVDALEARGLPVRSTREPGGTALGERIREILLGPGGPPISPGADALLFNAARAQLVVEVIRPALEAGTIVVGARHADSTLAYQGYGAGVSLAALRALADVAVGDLRPDRTILLDIPAEVGLARKTADGVTRFEASFDVEFHQRVREGFLALAAAEPERWVVIDASASPEDVGRQVLEAALALL